MIIEPRISDEANILFYPLRKHLQVTGDCISNISFETKTGYSITGKVEPATEGVEVRVINKKTNQDSLTVMTDKTGSYKVGPLYDD